ncbi:MAG: hypothetical protein IM466_00605 [Microcystis sp. M04BS1]|uniref:Ribbon-helix-helix protein CopG domain-containing protein n=2 Tax=Microcystis aeruginosa (strain PCC 7806) TaxID=267872 RepID=A0AB33BIX1_MICA7|nr:hypothetical protein [Microcystis aeruginosa]MCA2552284.1 hypothetical protein [Microcystis sp. M04BS1]MDY7049388.1 hypothetical protein [Microcystis panniformis WG22]NCR53015.1 hypothetical protein [Microcystis aeruginosa L211-07]TRT95956.1 MAG: hypothetical protein EWV61_21435 [Microcystis aeruginosa Ma_AC_P_19900807_S300]ARI80970.1 hypothetical protein BH695_1689 [Microcystis aeruginosa PCC 7806SL]
MSQVLTLELSDEVYAALQQQAKILGIDLSELVTTSLERQYRLNKNKDQRTEAEKEAARKRFERHIGSISGYPTGADNESIDADLAREYASNHEEG